jgi:hypothetical protein
VLVMRTDDANRTNSLLFIRRLHVNVYVKVDIL